ncbi:MAG TPA: hypothetical protein VHQ43_10125 [Solirubrobacterales bacterium]|nr:hypothetical protein [Solirubrobacterales bacterium]
MALAAPKFLGVQGVLGLTEFSRDPARDERFITAVRPEFQNVQNRQVLAPETPPQVPHLILASQSSQLSLSAAQAEFQVQFYGDYLDNIGKGLDFAERKLLAIFDGLESVGTSMSSIGLVSKFHFPYGDEDADSAPAHVMKTLTKVDVDPTDLEDASVRIALVVRNVYFVHLTVANYELREFEQPLRPGMQNLRLRQWQGTVAETGIELTLDINNKLEARAKQAEPEVTSEGVRAVVGMLKDVATTSGPKFAETGEISVANLVESSGVGAK